MAHLGELPFRRYYDSVDATPLFVMLARAHLERTDDIDAMPLAPNRGGARMDRSASATSRTSKPVPQEGRQHRGEEALRPVRRG
jgi:glycogen debranching enzyme